MKLVYTVSSGYMNNQNNHFNSLGGFPSSTPVPNDVLSNIFDELSISTVKNAQTQYCAIVLINDSQKVASGVELWFEGDETSNNICSFEIGATLLTVEEGSQYMESIPSSYSKPFNTQLYPATVEDKAAIGDILPGQMVGLWISRAIDKDKALAEYNNVAERDLETQSRYKPIKKIQEEGIDLKIFWEEV